MTMNGGSSGYVTPSTDTCRSSMHSSSAAWVFGEARFTSSTRRRFANTGPGRNSNSFCCWLKTLTPVTSDGRRSGVNWRRAKPQSSERASALASIVLPTPGKSSMIACPSATRQRTMSRSVSSGAWTTRPRFSTIVEICPLESGATARSAIPQQRLHLVEDRGGYLVLRRLRDRSLAGWSKERHLVLVRLQTDVGLGGAGERLALELGGGGRLDELDAGRRRHRQVGREERHLGTAPARLSGERDAHPPRRAVADEADRVERLAGAARRDEDALPAERARSHEQSTSGAKDLVRLRHPPHAELPLRRLALVRP